MNIRCFKENGRLKRGYPTKKLAKEQLMKGQSIYYCETHGWHIGTEGKRIRQRNKQMKLKLKQEQQYAV